MELNESTTITNKIIVIASKPLVLYAIPPKIPNKVDELTDDITYENPNPSLAASINGSEE
jgi:hypothetical protein